MNKIWWLWLPLGFMAIQILIETTLPHDVRANLHSEDGPHELMQFLAITAAFFIAVSKLVKMDLRAEKWLAAWLGLAAICCFYVAGEEASWGQHLLNWNTPEYWHRLNDQGETNLHNTSSWLDQKPRLLLEIGILIGGLIIPLLLKYKPAIVPLRFKAIYPPPTLMIIALLAVFIKICEKITGATGIVLFERASEVEELYLFYFVMLYLLGLKVNKKTAVS